LAFGFVLRPWLLGVDFADIYQRNLRESQSQKPKTNLKSEIFNLK